LKAYWKQIQDLIGPGGSYLVTVNVAKTDLYGDVAVSRGDTQDVVQLGSGRESDHENSPAGRGTEGSNSRALTRRRFAESLFPSYRRAK
jgi:hypothetical protein